MPDSIHTVALVTANFVLFAAALGVAGGLLWLAVATIRHRIRTAAQRIAFHTAARDAAGIDDGNELRHIDLSSVDLDAELLQLTEGGENQ